MTAKKYLCLKVVKFIRFSNRRKRCILRITKWWPGSDLKPKEQRSQSSKLPGSFAARRKHTQWRQGFSVAKRCSFQPVRIYQETPTSFPCSMKTIKSRELSSCLRSSPSWWSACPILRWSNSNLMLLLDRLGTRFTRIKLLKILMRRCFWSKQDLLKVQWPPWTSMNATKSSSCWHKANLICPCSNWRTTSS